MKFQVVVGNLGTMYDGNDELTARECFEEYATLSYSGVGRVGNESVTLMCDGEPVEEFNPSEREDDEDPIGDSDDF